MRDFKIGLARVRFEVTAMISDQTPRHEVHLPLYFSHFEIAEFTQFNQ